jgi:inosine-uridine nucleoside N-ribohydrolase
MTRHGVAVYSPAVMLLVCLGLGMAVPGAAHRLEAAAPGAVRNLILDTDMGLDDARAIFALLADSTIDLRAIITVEGSAALGRATDNVIGLLESVGSQSIQVMTGVENPDLEPPPWRQTADGLGGAAFAPPKEVKPASAVQGDLGRLLEEDPGVDYLALGPLSNLRLLEQETAGALLEIGTIWIPAHVRDGLITGWNLLYDAGASQAVFASGGSIIIIDISEAGQKDALAFMSSLEGNSASVLWIRHLLSDMGGTRAHVMLSDEIAVAALSRRDLLRFDQQSYSVKVDGEHALELVPSPDGNVRVATLVDIDGALAILKDLWEHGPLERAALPTDAVPESLRRGRRAHPGGPVPR